MSLRNFNNVAKLLANYVGPLTETVLMYLPMDIKLVPHMVSMLQFEDFDNKVVLSELPIIGYTFVPISRGRIHQLSVQLFIHYKTYDNHNEPYLISVLGSKRGHWVLKNTFVSWERTKYKNRHGFNTNPEYEKILTSINWTEVL